MAPASDWKRTSLSLSTELGRASVVTDAKRSRAMGMVLNVTVVGCGAVAQKLYRRPLQKLTRLGILDVTGLVDKHVPHAETMRSFFPRATVYDDLEQALRAKQSDLTLVLSPAHLHARHTILALRHGNHVLCEKPMAITGAECDEMIAAAGAARRLLAIGMVRRFFPSFARLRQCISRQEIGELQSFSYREGRKFDWDVTTPAGFGKTSAGGSGVLLDVGPHMIDFLIWLFGVPKVVSYADDALAGAEANVVMELETPACAGTVQLSWDFPLRNEMRVIGSRGEAVLRVDQFDKLAVKTASEFKEVLADHRYPADTRQPARETVSPRLYTQSVYCQLIQVIRAIQLGEPPAVDGEAGKECVSVIESARRCARPIDMAWLSPCQQEAFQALHWTKA